MAKRIKGSNVQAVITDGKVTGLAVNGQDIGVVTAKTSANGLAIENGSATRSFVTAEVSAGVPTGNFT